MRLENTEKKRSAFIAPETVEIKRPAVSPRVQINQNKIAPAPHIAEDFDEKYLKNKIREFLKIKKARQQDKNLILLEFERYAEIFRIKDAMKISMGRLLNLFTEVENENLNMKNQDT